MPAWPGAACDEGISHGTLYPLIQVRNLDLYFGAFHALKDVSVDFHAGELVGLVGDNGGCLLAGGRISLIGAVVGAFVLSSIHSYLVVMAVQPQWFILLLGIIVVLAALGDRSLRQWALKK